MFAGILGKAQEHGIVYEVAMDEVKFHPFGESGKSSIGTAYLGGCSAVMIVSKYAAIVGHTAPLPPNSHPSDIHAGDRHAQERMDEVAKLYHTNRKYFKREGSWVLCAMYAGELGLPDQQRIMTDSFLKMGLLPDQVTYTVGEDRREPFPGQGTVYIDGNGVYIEDRKVSKDDIQLYQPEASSHGAVSPYYAYAPLETTRPYAYPATGASGSYMQSYYSQGTAVPSSSRLPANVEVSYSSTYGQKAATQSSQDATTSETHYIHDEEIEMVRKGNEDYYHFYFDGKKHETKKAEWVEVPTEVDGRQGFYWMYTSKRTGIRYWRWMLSDIPMSSKGKGKGKGKGR